MDEPHSKSSLLWLWIVLAIAILGTGGWLGYQWLHPAATPPDASTAGKGKGGKGGPVPVVVARAHKGNLDIYLNGLGTVTPLYTAAVHTRVDGNLDKVWYVEGQEVTAGTLLCEIDARPFKAMLAQANGQLARDQALLQDAVTNLKRFKDLQKQGDAITQAQVDTQAALVDQYQGTVDADNGIKQADEVNLAYCQIRAPISGRVGLRLVDPGNIVHASDTMPLVVITQVQPITVIFTIPEDNIPQVMAHYDSKEPMPVEAWNRDLTTKLATGKVLAIDNAVDPTTGTIKIRATFDNTKNELFPNEFTNARLLVNTLRGAIIVPVAAIQRGPDSTFVYVVNLDDAEKDPKAGTVEIRTVTVGPAEGDKTVIESGLKPGDLVVTDGVDKLEKGTKVKIGDRPSKKKGTTEPATTQASDAAASGSGNEPEATTRPSADAGRHHPKKGAGE